MFALIFETGSCRIKNRAQGQIKTLLTLKRPRFRSYFVKLNQNVFLECLKKLGHGVKSKKKLSRGHDFYPIFLKLNQTQCLSRMISRSGPNMGDVGQKLGHWVKSKKNLALKGRFPSIMTMFVLCIKNDKRQECIFSNTNNFIQV